MVDITMDKPIYDNYTPDDFNPIHDGKVWTINYCRFV